MSHSRRGSWAGLLTVSVLGLALVAVPVVLIRPFAPQTPDSMALAFTLRRWSPLMTVIGAALAVFMVVRLWRSGSRLLLKIAAGMVGVVALASAWMARQNHFEWMFAPLPGPGFVHAAKAAFVEPGDMVLTVAVNGDPVAYPVRQLAYHHVVQDFVGRVPIVATY